MPDHDPHTPTALPAAPPGPNFSPNHAQQALLAAVIQDPAIGSSTTLMAEAVKMHVTTVQGWFASFPFRAWWHEQMLEVARVSIGPATVQLSALMQSPGVSAMAKIRAVDTMVKVLGAPKGSQSVGAAVTAILERWNGSGSVRLAARGEQLAMEIGEMGVGDNPESPASVIHNPHYRKLREGEEEVDLPPEQVVQMSPPTVNQVARGLTRTLARELAETVEKPPPTAEAEAPAPPPMAPVSRATPTGMIAVKGRGVEDHKVTPPDPKGSDAYNSPNPSDSPVPPHRFEPGDPMKGERLSVCRRCGLEVGDHGQKLDFRGRAFTPRGEGESKPPPGS